eukprot:scaffold7751_cov49-Phaeocystis_antarctica.AAC.2
MRARALRRLGAQQLSGCGRPFSTARPTSRRLERSGRPAGGCGCTDWAALGRRAPTASRGRAPGLGSGSGLGLELELGLGSGLGLGLGCISRRSACSVLTRPSSVASTLASSAVSPAPPAAEPPPPLSGAPPPPCRRGALNFR